MKVTSLQRVPACALTWLALLYTACGTATPREPPCNPCVDRSAMNIKVVLQDSNVFFRQMRRAMLSAAELLKVQIQVDLPLVSDPAAMAAKIDEAAETRPDALIVSIPDAQVRDATGRATASGVPVFSVFSGADIAKDAGTLAHFGMDETTSCLEAAEALFAEASNRSVQLKRCIALTPTGLDRSPFTERSACFRNVCEARNLTFESFVVNTFDTAAAKIQLDQKLEEMRLNGGLEGTAFLGLNPGSVKTLIFLSLGTAPDSEWQGIVIGSYDLELSLYNAMDNGKLVFQVDSGVWLQGFMSVLVAVIWAGTDNLMVNHLYPTGPFIVSGRRSQQQEPLRNGCTWEERHWLGFPVCGCPWAGQNEAAVPTSECTAIGESPDPDGGLDCGCEDVRQYKIRGFAPYPYGDLNFYIADGGLTQVALDLRAEVTFRMPQAMNPFLEGEWIREAADDPDVTGIFPVIGAPESEEAVRYAVSKGKIVVGINAGSHVSQSLGAVGQVGMDEYNAGRAVCQELLRLQPGIKHIHGIPYEYSNFAHFQRLAGCVDFMRENNVQASNSTPGLYVDLSDTDAVGNFIADQLRNDPTIDAIYPTTAFLAAGVIKAMDAVGQSYHVGTIDVLSDTVQQVVDGLLLFTGDQQFHLQGYMPAMYVAMYKISGSILRQHTLEPGPFFIYGQNPAKEACTLQPWTEELVGSLYASEARLSFPACQFKPPQDCIPGYELNLENDCVPCAPGFYKSTTGQTPCEPCGLGTFATGGNASCTFCPVGTYGNSSQQSECVQCPDPFTTEAIAHTSNESCICREGYYGIDGRFVDGGSCLPCVEAMTCPLGSHAEHLPGGIREGQGPYPRVDSGFMTLSTEPFEPYKCLEKDQCLGGPPANCARLRNASVPACAVCVDDAHERDGDCVSCEGASVILPSLVLLVIAIVGTAVITLVVNRDVYGQTNGTMMVVVTAGLLVTGVQAMGVFKELQLEWFEPLDAIIDAMSIFSLDLDVVNIACVVGSDPNASYGLRQLGAPATVLVIAFGTLLFKKHAPIGKLQRPNTMVLKEFINTVGTILNIFFISVLISAVAPLTCYKHPGPGDRWSVTIEPGTLCNFEGDHVGMIMWGCASLLLICIPYLGLAAFGTWKYPRMTGSEMAPVFLSTFRFLFFRFQPYRYYYGLLFLFRSTLICLAPVLIRNDAGLQVAYLVLIILVMMQVQQALYPWRVQACNIVDGALQTFLVMILLSGSLLTSLSLKTSTFRAIATAFFLFTVVAFVVLFLTMLTLRLKPRKKFDVFLCHHKAHASAQVRLLKILLQVEKGQAFHVFIDSDDLRDLDELFDIVKSSVAHFVAFLTGMTITRPWCAGEIAVATMCGLSRSRVITSSFRAPSEAALSDMDNFLGDLSLLQQYEVSGQDVQEALGRLCSGSGWRQVELQEAIGVSGKFREVATALLGIVSHEKYEALSLPEGLSDAVFISTDSTRDEAVATGAILYRKLLTEIYNICEAGVFLLADYLEDDKTCRQAVQCARAVIVILNLSCFDSPSQVDVICHSMMGANSAVIPVMLPSFVYPSSADMIGQLSLLYEGESDRETVQELLQTFCKRIAFPLSIHASETILATQMASISEAIPRKTKTTPVHGGSMRADRKSSSFQADSSLPYVLPIRRTTSGIRTLRSGPDEPPLPIAEGDQPAIDVSLGDSSRSSTSHEDLAEAFALDC